jgi:Holliday junction resolvasome RuvABC endonuclease subunit
VISLGIDPGGQKGLAWAVYDSEADHLTVGMHRPFEGLDPCVAAFDFLFRLLEEREVDSLAVEVPHVKRLPEKAVPKDRKKLLGVLYAQGAAALKLAEVVGACKAAAAARGVPAVGLQPAEIKRAMVGKGNASKAEVRDAVSKTYDGKTTLIRGPRERHVLREDEADAAATAVAAQRCGPAPRSKLTDCLQGVLL